jgi:hypothetical protein
MPSIACTAFSVSFRVRYPAASTARLKMKVDW